MQRWHAWANFDRGVCSRTRRLPRGRLRGRSSSGQIADILSDNSARTLSFGMNSALRFPYPVACKTGTSTDFRDNWTIGFTPEFTVGVWVGNFDGSPMREVSGVTGAGPIFHAIFDHLHETRGTSWYRTPPEIVERSIHPLTGKLVAGNTPRAVREICGGSFSPNESPGDYDSAGARSSGRNMRSGWPAGRMTWPTARPSERARRCEIISPLPGSVFVIDPDIPSSGLIPLFDRGNRARELAKRFSRVVRKGGRIVAHASEGEHRIIAIERESGRTAETWISVRSL